jgi:hypothetical protein
MCEEININVNETNENINIISTEIVEVIDINVGETIEEVTFNITEEVIQVNINKVTGGGGEQTLAETLVLGNTTDGENISISNGDAIILDNGSMLKKGTIDAGNGGSKGIAQICGVGFEHKWEAGRLYIMNDGGTIIREVSHNLTYTPTVTDDVTKGFVQNTRWILDNGDLYVCTDPTEGAAVWEFITGAVPTLQQVTDEGATTTNDITITDGFDTANLYKSQIEITDNFSNQVGFTSGGFYYVNPTDGKTYTLNLDGLGFNGNYLEANTDVVANKYWKLINENGELQTTTLKTTSFTAVNSAFYLTNGTLTVTDPTPVTNKGYIVHVIVGTSTIGGVGYTSGALVYRFYNGTAWVSTDMNSVGGVTSVGLTMPSAFSVTNSPITSSGDIAVTGAGLVSQYVRGDGTLANFPASTGGGASLSFYLNGSVSQGTIGGVAFREMDRTPILGAGTDFTINANGYIQSFITDAGVPNQLEIPAGNWNFETYFSASSGGGSPSFYVELYKWNGTTLSLIASNSATPEGITNGTAIDAYFSALAVPQTSLLATDRLAIRIYVNHSGRTIKLHTENSHLSQIITTFSSGITALNGLTDQVQYFNVGTGATNFNISSSSNTHTFNLLFNIRRNANNSSNNNINYNGYAVTGSAESSAVWTIKRLTITASGSITVATATNVAWTDRETATYT